MNPAIPTSDVIVIGSGANGGWAAMALTAAGLDVLLLEAGPESPAPGEAAQPIQSACYAWSEETRHLFVDDDELPYTTPEGRPFLWIRGRQLGGRTALWARVALRLGAADLEGEEGEEDGWPLTYDALAPHYDRVERFLGVTGHRDDHPIVPNGELLPAPPLCEGELRLRDAVAARWPDRAVLRARVASADGAHRGASAGAHPFSSSAGSTIAVARETGRLRLITGAVVREILCDPGSGRARGVAWVDRETGAEREAEARAVVLCASTIESTRILLLSRSPRHPSGLGDHAGVLGRYLMDHLYTGPVAGVVEGLENLDPSVSAGLTIPRFRNVAERWPAFRGGFGIDVAVQRAIPAESVPPALAAAAASGAHFKMVSFGEVLPRAENRVTLDPERRDRLGIPVPRIDFAYGDNERALAADQVASMQAIAEAAGFRILLVDPEPALPGLSNHEVGTARMGRDPARSVLDPHNRIWGAPNVYVTDGACFPRNPCQNPTLTMMALTDRACDHLIAALRGS
ncbi:MAG: GMC family oxidoreductase [Nannocystaceae bacterium]